MIHSRAVAAVAGVAAFVIAGSASAQVRQPKKLDAKFLCGVFVGGKITKPITGAKLGKVTDPIACALHLADADEPGHAVHVRTVRNGKEMSSVTGVVNEDGAKDFEIYLKPGVKDANGAVAWKTCEDFDIEATIMDPGGQFKKVIKVVAGCPKPRPIKAQLYCFSNAGDGTPLEFPKLKKLKGRLEQNIDCVIASTNVPDGVKLNGAVWTKGKAPHKAEMFDAPGGGQKMEAKLEPGTDFDVCAVKFTIQGSLVDADGAERWTGKLDIPAQFCPD